MKKFKTCWWSFSKQCKEKDCSDCFYYLPTVKGEIDQPDFRNFKKDIIEEGLKEAFIKRNFPKTLKNLNKKTVKQLDKETKELILNELKKIRHSPKQIHMVRRRTRNQNVEWFIKAMEWKGGE